MLRIALALLLALPFLAGCGGDPAEDGVFVRIITSDIDGPVAGALRAKALDDGQGTVYDLVRTDEEGVWRAPGAKPGPYRLYSDAGWGMLWTGRTGGSAPRLRGHDFPAAVVRMGKPRSLYVAIADPSLPSAPVTTTWAAEVKALDAGDGVPFTPVELDITDQGEGIVGLHFPETHWRRGVAIRAVGVMGDDSVSELLRYTVRDAELSELPRMALVFPSPQAPLTVHLVTPDGTPAADGIPVRIHIGGIPLPARLETESYKGTARFDTLPTLGQGLRVVVGAARRDGLPGDAAAWYLDQEIWRRRQAMHVLRFDPERVQRYPLGGGDKASVREVRVLPEGSATFALVPVVAEGTPHPEGHVAALLPHGRGDMLVGREDDTWEHIVYQANAEGGSGTRIGKVGRRARVRGMARGAGIQGRVRFTRVLPPHDEALPERQGAGQGFEAALTMDGAFELELPPGRYHVRIWTPAGPRGRGLTQTFNPGADARLQLSTR